MHIHQAYNSDEPKSVRKPIRIASALTSGIDSLSNDSPAPRTPRRRIGPKLTAPNSDDGITLVADPTPLGIGSPSYSRPPHILPSTPPSNRSPTKLKPPRTTKKAQAAAEQARREAYAREIFQELNRIVFKDELPKETKLNWSKRLLTTAGRAKWHR